MTQRSLLGRLGSFRLARAAEEDPDTLHAALAPGGDATTQFAGAIQVAASPPYEKPPGTARTLCLLDGSIVDREAIAATLGMDSETPAEEVLARGFERSGETFIDQLQGSYVLVLWDRERRSGLLVRDPLGTRPLFLIGQGRHLMFASEIRPLLEVLPSRPPPDALGLAYWLARRITPPELTLFEGVQRLPAGHLVRLTEDGFRIWRWWKPRFRAPAARPMADAAVELRDQMTAAVRRVIGQTDAVGIRLSGGFDSGSIAALATSTLGLGGLRSYSVVYPDHPQVDESTRISELRKHLGVQGVERPFHTGSALSAAAPYIATWAVPPSSPNWFVWRPLIERAAADGIEVLLDGEGGDELFGCSPYLLADLLRRGRLFELMATAGKIPGAGRHPPPHWIRRALGRYAARGALPPRIHMLMRRRQKQREEKPPWLAESTFDLLLDSERPYAWKESPGPRWWAGLVDALVNVPDAQGFADELRRVATMGGVRFAHPWRDFTLIEYMLAQPPELSFDPIHDRPVAREAMRGLLPDPIRLNEQKPIFNVLLQKALTDVDGPLVKDLVLNPPDELALHLKKSELPGLVDKRGTILGAHGVWRVATAALWLRKEADPDSLSPFLE